MLRSKKDKAIRWGISKPQVVNRFNSKLKPQANGCIEYDGFAWDSRDRYRGFNIYPTKECRGKHFALVKAHRFAFALHYGYNALPRSTKNAPKTKVINHICFNTRCVNPLHLNILTNSENSKYQKDTDNDSN